MKSKTITFKDSKVLPKCDELVAMIWWSKMKKYFFFKKKRTEQEI